MMQDAKLGGVSIVRSVLVDGAFLNRLNDIEALVIELTFRLQEAEEAAAFGRGRDEPAKVGHRQTHGGGVETKLSSNGHLLDSEVKRYRRMQKTWAYDLLKVISRMEDDLNANG
jgi:hypothetical protein